MILLVDWHSGSSIHASTVSVWVAIDCKKHVDNLEHFDLRVQSSIWSLSLGDTACWVSGTATLRPAVLPYNTQRIKVASWSDNGRCGRNHNQMCLLIRLKWWHEWPVSVSKSELLGWFWAQILLHKLLINKRTGLLVLGQELLVNNPKLDICFSRTNSCASWLGDNWSIKIKRIQKSHCHSMHQYAISIENKWSWQIIKVTKCFIHVYSPSLKMGGWKTTSFWDGFLAGAMWVSGSVNPHDSASMSELSTSAALARSAQEAKYLGDRALTQSPTTFICCLLYPSLTQQHCRCRPVQSSQASNQIIYCTIDIPVPSERPR